MVAARAELFAGDVIPAKRWGHTSSLDHIRGIEDHTSLFIICVCLKMGYTPNEIAI